MATINTINSDKYFEEPTATIFDGMRKEAREKRRITYDCYNAIVIGKQVVECRFGFPIGMRKKGMMSLREVLKGRSCRICQECPEYNGD